MGHVLTDVNKNEKKLCGKVLLFFKNAIKDKSLC